MMPFTDLISRYEIIEIFIYLSEANPTDVDHFKKSFLFTCLLFYFLLPMLTVS